MSIFRKNKKEEKPAENKVEENSTPLSNEKNDNQNLNNETTIDSANKVHIIVEQNNATSLTAEEKKAKINSRLSLSFKIFLLLIVAFLLGWSIYSFVILFSGDKKSNHSYLLLDGKNYTQSKTIYDSFATGDVSLSNKKNINDYYLVGTQLFVSKTNINPTIYNQVNKAELITGQKDSDFSLYNLTTDEIYTASSATDIKNNKYSIDLNFIVDGDYLIYPTNLSDSVKKDKKDYYPYSINSDETIYLEGYTLPNKNGSRKKITIKNNSVSPYTLVSIFDAGSVLPALYYDAVIYNASYDTALNSREKDDNFVNDVETNIVSKIQAETNNIYSIKVCSSILEARNYHSALSIALTNEADILRCSKFVEGHYLNKGFSSSVISEIDSFSLVGYDKDPDIRENMGLINEAGSAFANVIGNNLFTKDDSRVVKESFLVSKDRLLEKYNILFRTII